MTSETPTEAQDASVAAGDSLAAPENAVWLGRLGEKLTEWQHFVFNSSQHHPNRVGMAEVAHQIQVAAYELRIMMGQSELEAKQGAGMTLSPEEQSQLNDRLEEARRKESVRRATEDLRG